MVGLFFEKTFLERSCEVVCSCGAINHKERTEHREETPIATNLAGTRTQAKISGQKHQKPPYATP
jgi:hypothetical protein